ncbi:MAG: DUF192 domain-containing protein [Spirochaetia bacterium]|nr:DUF192 domain-containing protein [Spirochaetia bacterium]
MILKLFKILRNAAIFLTLILLANQQILSQKNSQENRKDQNLDKVTVYFETAKKTEALLFCEVAKTEKERARGLMFRKKLKENEGMIFIFEKPDLLSFWMRNTKIPLSIAFIDENMYILEIYKMEPFDDRIITSTTKAKYAVEANSGWFANNFIIPGKKMRFNLKKKG